MHFLGRGGAYINELCGIQKKTANMIETVDAGISIADKTISFIDNVLDKIEKYKKIKQDTTVYLRILYLEIVNNLEVMKTINFEKFSSIKPNDKNLQTILKLIQTEISESVFYKSSDNPNTELYDKLRKKGKVDNRGKELLKTNSKGDEIKITNRFVYENILQALSFVVTKVELMNKYSMLNESETDILKQMNFKSRLININQRLLMIKKTMDNFDEIKEMAR